MLAFNQCFITTAIILIVLEQFLFCIKFCAASGDNIILSRIFMEHFRGVYCLKKVLTDFVLGDVGGGYFIEKKIKGKF